MLFALGSGKQIDGEDKKLVCRKLNISSRDAEKFLLFEQPYKKTKLDGYLNQSFSTLQHAWDTYEHKLGVFGQATSIGAKSNKIYLIIPPLYATKQLAEMYKSNK